MKKEQGEKITPNVFKITDTQSLQEYLDKERIINLGDKLTFITKILLNEANYNKNQGKSIRNKYHQKPFKNQGKREKYQKSNEVQYM